MLEHRALSGESRRNIRQILLGALLAGVITVAPGLTVKPVQANEPLAISWQAAQAISALKIIDTTASKELVTRWRQSPVEATINSHTSTLLMKHVSDLSGNPELWSDKIELYKFARAIRNNSVDQYLRAMTAPNPVAQGLKKAQIRYMEIESTGGWPNIPAGPGLQQGLYDERLPLLRQRLLATGDLNIEDAGHEGFDITLTEAVQRFQQRHSLPVDGIVGERTLREMNVPVHKRIAAIRLSRSRAEELPAGSRADYVWVNIAGANTHLVRKQQTIWSGRSVVGKRETRTPEMASKIETLVLNPYWMVPDSIAKASLLPRAAREPNFLARMKYRAFDSNGRNLDLNSTDWNAVVSGNGPEVRLTQSPGPRNALGKVKFLFPNEHAVFLHDTPSKKGFLRSRRDLSNGCVRVEGALSLATMLLEPQGWDRQRIDEALEGGKPVKLTLEKPLPVHTLYLTAMPGHDGEVKFYSDSYRKDTSSALAQLN